MLGVVLAGAGLWFTASSVSHSLGKTELGSTSVGLAGTGTGQLFLQ